MIVILFPPGGFGTTIEYSLRQFSNEFTTVDVKIMKDGSMHGYKKEFHALSIDQFAEIENKKIPVEIATPIYPGFDSLDPINTVKKLHKFMKNHYKVVIIHHNTVAMAERNQLFVNYKIPDMVNGWLKNKHKDWNPAYTSCNDMQLFEKREALSLYFDDLSSYLKIQENIIKDWLYITTDDILFNFKNTILKIIDHCELTIDYSKNIDNYYSDWFAKQKYILDEFDAINRITDSIKSEKYLKWKRLSIVGEAIIESRLRRQGMEIACYNLNVFPTNSEDLKKVIINKK
jgi:hypothetical protein